MASYYLPLAKITTSSSSRYSSAYNTSTNLSIDGKDYETLPWHDGIGSIKTAHAIEYKTRIFWGPYIKSYIVTLEGVEGKVRIALDNIEKLSKGEEVKEKASEVLASLKEWENSSRACQISSTAAGVRKDPCRLTPMFENGLPDLFEVHAQPEEGSRAIPL